MRRIPSGFQPMLVYVYAYLVFGRAIVATPYVRLIEGHPIKGLLRKP
jgi:hypothetical protein